MNKGHLEKLVSLVFRGALRDLSIGGRVNNQRLTLQLIMSLPPNPHPVEVFRCAQHEGKNNEHFREVCFCCYPNYKVYSFVGTRKERQIRPVAEDREPIARSLW